jgi:hypothetical protein
MKVSDNLYNLHTYVLLMLYPRRDSRDMSDIPMRQPRFTNMKIMNIFVPV